jgi:hypothetical protein
MTDATEQEQFNAVFGVPFLIQRTRSYGSRRAIHRNATSGCSCSQNNFKQRQGEFSSKKQGLAMKELTVKTGRHSEFAEITSKIQQAVDEIGIKESVCIVAIPHTTAGVTVNKNADPGVTADMIYALAQAVPWKLP